MEGEFYQTCIIVWFHKASSAAKIVIFSFEELIHDSELTIIRSKQLQLQNNIANVCFHKDIVTSFWNLLMKASQTSVGISNLGNQISVRIF